MKDACGSAALAPGPVDLLLVHPYVLALDDSRTYELLPYPPLGLLSLAAVARRAGYRVAIHDATFSNGLHDIDTTLEGNPPRLIGVGSWSSYRGNSQKFLAHLAARGLPVVAGGPDPSLYPEQYLEAGARVVAVGEAETTLLELLRAALGEPGGDAPADLDPSRLQGIAGLVWRASSLQRTRTRERIGDLDALPLPAYDLVPTALYLEAWEHKFGYASLPLMAARGCPFQCTWCARPSFGKIYTQRSVPHVLAEIRHLVETLGARYIRIVDDTFVIRKNWVREFAGAVRESGLQFEYECLARVELLTDDVVEALRSSGCVKVFCGVESGSQKVLDAMKKGTTVRQILDAGERLRRAGIRFHSYLMLGYPGERHRDVRMTLRLLRRLAPDEHSVSIAYPMPGTEFHDLVASLLPEERGWENRDDVNLKFRGEYSRLYYRLARSLCRRRYAPRRPRGVRAQLHGWGLEAALEVVRARDGIFMHRPRYADGAAS